MPAAQMVVSTVQDIAARDMRAEKTRTGTLPADNRKMLAKHDFESVFSDDAAAMKGLFWNPTEVADVAWRQLLSKLSAVAAIDSAPDDDAIVLDDSPHKRSRHSDVDE